MSTTHTPAFRLNPAEEVAMDRRRLPDLKAAVAECRRLVAIEERCPADLRNEGVLAQRKAHLAHYLDRLTAAEAAP